MHRSLGDTSVIFTRNAIPTTMQLFQSEQHSYLLRKRRIGLRQSAASFLPENYCLG